MSKKSENDRETVGEGLAPPALYAPRPAAVWGEWANVRVCPSRPFCAAIPCFAQNVLCIVLYRKPACAKPFAAVWGEARVACQWANVRVCPSRITALEYGRGKPHPYGEIRNFTKNMVYRQTFPQLMNGGVVLFTDFSAYPRRRDSPQHTVFAAVPGGYSRCICRIFRSCRVF